MKSERERDRRRLNNTTVYLSRKYRVESDSCCCMITESYSRAARRVDASTVRKGRTEYRNKGGECWRAIAFPRVSSRLRALLRVNVYCYDTAARGRWVRLDRPPLPPVRRCLLVVVFLSRCIEIENPENTRMGRRVVGKVPSRSNVLLAHLASSKF